MRSVLSQSFDFGYEEACGSRHLAFADALIWPRPTTPKEAGRSIPDDQAGLPDVYTIVVVEQCLLAHTQLPKIMRQIEPVFSGIASGDVFRASPVLHCVFDGSFWVVREKERGRPARTKWVDPVFNGRFGLDAIQLLFPAVYQHVCDVAENHKLTWLASSHS